MSIFLYTGSHTFILLPASRGLKAGCNDASRAELCGAMGDEPRGKLANLAIARLVNPRELLVGVRGRFRPTTGCRHDW